MKETERIMFLWRIAHESLSQDSFSLWLCGFHGAVTGVFKAGSQSLRAINDVSEEMLLERIKEEYPKIFAVWLCDRCDAILEHSDDLEEMPNGDFVCQKCMEAEETEVAKTFADAYESEMNQWGR